MFCDQCGMQLEDSSNFCTRCGRRLYHPAPAAPPLPLPATVNAPQPAQVPHASLIDGRVKRHLQLLAIFWLIYAAIRLVGVFWLFAVGRVVIPTIVTAIVSLSQPVVHHFPFGWLFSESLGFIAAWIAFWAVLEFIAAWGLLEHASWARIFVLVLALLSVLRFPLGTLLAIYTSWVLLPAHAGAEYDRLSRP